ncbi:mevalonate kinase [Ascoidea rubescens DSM 1968]|uniref:Mevalonate kinase n=1 Tax=Ascoidea rubescens DSM 1968 TaxID=1344418 RepID=A0A1D2VR62_9ASCO|nr:mevalonate kinase [Ascoidea rubescens DSM 1968]ODV64096.1 mevalonate kinase [Ascoidea rubescens DSM 1968]
MTITNQPNSTPFIVSSPGKVIIFGEHAAVFGKPAIAAAVSLRTYLLVAPSKDPNTINLNFPDINFSHKWSIHDIPWSIKDNFNNNDDDNNNTNDKNIPKPDDELVPEYVSSLSELILDINDTIHYCSASAFLYLYLNLCSLSTIGHTFTIRSTLPIGAGLGSSASMAVCLSSALSYLGNHIQSPSIKNNDFTTIDSPDSLFIDSWAFMAEKCIHGNPSGIDNTVSCHGGAIMFQRMKSSNPSIRTKMRNFPSLNLLLTNTTHPRKTADLVANVSSFTNEFPKTSGSILDAIESLTREAYNIMIRPFFDNDAKFKISQLIRINHGLLVSLGVSHPTLENIKLQCDLMDIGESKLTGAGGGGCAITILKDDADQSKVSQIITSFKNEGYKTYQTTLGGKGVGLLLPNYVDINNINTNTNTNTNTHINRNPNYSKIFTQDGFLSFKTQKEIENTFGVQNAPDWRFW